MADIFISYSRRDSEQALSLAERLRASGASVWIDTAALTAAETWSAEIVNAINSCKTFIILLSPDSVASHNVTKELSLASEKRKTIVPIVIAECKLNESMEYALAGLQQVSITDEEALERAFAKFGITGSGFSQTISRRSEKKSSSLVFRLSALLLILCAVTASYFLFFSKTPTAELTGPRTIAVLPFENLSSDKENEYFADGMTATLIDMLVPIPGLRVVDRKTAMEYKGSKKNLKTIAGELGVRYIVDGSIQKQGNTIKVNIQISDVQTGKILKSKTFDGTTTDLMAMQEQLARLIIYELQLAFNPSGITLPFDVSSEVPEAYNLCMIGGAIGTGSPEEITLAISYFLQAAKLDTSLAFAYLSAARQYGNLHTLFPDSAASYRSLILADSLFTIGKRLDTAGVNHHFFGSWLATVHGDYESAIKEANMYLQKRPDDYRGYMVLALAYDSQGKYDLAAANWEEAAKRNSMHLHFLYNLCASLYNLEDSLRLKKYCSQAIPLYRLATIRHPDDLDLSNDLTWFLTVSGDNGDEACRRIDERIKPPGDTPGMLVYAACVHALNNNTQHAMELLKMAVKKGNILKLLLDQPPLKNLRSLPEYQALLKTQKEALAKNKKKNG